MGQQTRYYEDTRADNRYNDSRRHRDDESNMRREYREQRGYDSRREPDDYRRDHRRRSKSPEGRHHERLRDDRLRDDRRYETDERRYKDNFHHDDRRYNDHSYDDRRHKDSNYSRHRDRGSMTASSSTKRNVDMDPVKFDRERRLSPVRGRVCPLRDRPRPLDNWDKAPPGFERIRADIAKQTGLFPPPGNVAKIANFCPPVLDPARAAMLAMLSQEDGTSGGDPFVGGQAFGAAYAKHTKRLYFGNLPVGIEEQDLVDFINAMLLGDNEADARTQKVERAMMGAGGNGGGGDYAFVDFVSTEWAMRALDLDNVTFMGSQIKVKRPKDPAERDDGAQEDPGQGHLVFYNVPVSFSEAHVRLLLSMIGDLKVFIYLRHRVNKEPCGMVIVQFEESVFNDIAVQVFRELGSDDCRMERLADVRGNEGVWPVLSGYGLIPDPVSCESSCVVAVYNMIPGDQILQAADKDFDRVERDLLEYTTELLGAPPVKVLQPRPRNGTPVPGMGACFVELNTNEDAERVCDALAGRRYNNEVIVCSLYPHDRYSSGTF